jgi:hypothetical protein
VKSEPLTDAELERLSGVLGRFDNKHPMNLEKLDVRHWNFVADTLHSGDVFLPLLLEDRN